MQKFEYLKNDRSFLDETKNTFHSFWKAIIWWKMKILSKIADKSFKEIRSNIIEKNKTCKMLDEKFVSLVEEAEKKNDKNLVVQANALKRKKWGNRREKKKAWRDT